MANKGSINFGINLAELREFYMKFDFQTMKDRDQYQKINIRMSMLSVGDLFKKRLNQLKSLHWFHWMILIFSLVLTLCIWQFSQKQVEEKAQSKFRREAQQFQALILERLTHYEDALYSGVAFLATQGWKTDYPSWKRYVEGLNLLSKYPGVNGLGLIENVTSEQLPEYLKKHQTLRPDYRVHPPQERERYLPITYIIPVELNQEAIGLDIMYEKNRYEAALRARDSGKPQATAPIVLVQDKKKTPGFLLYLPFYNGESSETEVLRKRHFKGLVYTPFIFGKLINGTLSQKNRHVDIKILDGHSILYDEIKNQKEIDSQFQFKRVEQIQVYGRTWTFEIICNQKFRNHSASNGPLIILLTGLIIDGLLLFLFVNIAHSHQKASRYAHDMTVSIRAKAEKLAKSNEELDKFAYVVSHDLRAPLRGIANLVTWIEEDESERLSDGGREYIQNLKTCTNQMDHLINGILAYSRVGDGSDKQEKVDLNSCIESIMLSLGQPSHVHLEVPKKLPVIFSNSTIIRQIFSNLISNSIKYVDKPDVKITITYKENPEYYTFSVKDNGPGIKPEFHDKVFQLFQTLQPIESTDSSGIGLAIVKKMVESQSGQIQIVSEENEGCIFEFNWMKRR